MSRLKFSAYVLTLVLHADIFAQAPAIAWDNTIKGESSDYIKGISPTSDGGFIIAAASSSPVAQDKTLPSLGGNDFWIVKLKPSGGIKWQKVLGGNLNDDPYALAVTTDGGYVVGGTSYSGISGNKTENSMGGSDFWVVKLSETGVLLWQNTIGGSANDYLFGLTSTMDGGVAIIGQSLSGISGDKTEPVIGAAGGYDYWIVKLDALGNIEWQNTIGGTFGDIGTSIKQLSDGSYIIGGISWSGITGDKTESNIGGSDMWVLKLSSTGDIIWQNAIGTTDYESTCVVIPTNDGGFMVGGSAYQYADGDKTETGHNVDMWVLKLNSTGAITWQNTIVGPGDDFFSDIITTADGGYLVGGVSYSNAGYDKSENRLNTSPDLTDLWIVKLNNTGNILWENTIGGDGGDFLFGNIAQIDDGGYVIGASSESPASDDKTENSNDPDLWLLKISADSCTPAIEICNSIDDDCNGLTDDDVVENCSIVAEGDTSFCSGGSVNLSATYSGISIQWYKNGVIIPGATSPSYTASKKGTYTAQTTSDCGTALSNEIFVNVYKNPSAFISPGGPTIFCAGDSVILSVNPVAGCTYQWYQGPTPIAGATSLNYTATTTGNYKCRVTKTASGCFKNSNAIAVSVPCREGLSAGEAGETDALLNEFSVYPNPAQHFITIESSFMLPVDIQIRTISGQLIAQQVMLSGTSELDISAWPPGVYYLHSTTEKDIIVTQFIKQ